MPDNISALGPLTEAGVPLSLRPFFQDYRLEDIDPVRDSFTVIERTLAWGSRAELRWLFSHYTQAEIAEFVRSAGWWRLPKPRFYYWLNILSISQYEKSDYQRLWPR